MGGKGRIGRGSWAPPPLHSPPHPPFPRAGAGGSWAVFASAGQLSNASAASAGGPLALTPGAWHTAAATLGAAASAGATLSVDGAVLASAVPLGGATAGFVGIATARYGDASLFDKIATTAALPPSPSPPPPPPSCPKRRRAPAAAAPAAACRAPAVGDPVVTLVCGSGGAAAWSWTPSPAHPGYGALSLGGLCVGANASTPNPQTGAPGVQLQACSATEAAQLWTELPAPGASGRVASASGACMEVTKNELGPGVLLETWGCNGGLNQAWCWAAEAEGGELSSLLDGMCAGVCVQ